MGIVSYIKEEIRVVRERDPAIIWKCCFIQVFV